MRNLVIDTCVLIHIVRYTVTGKNCLDTISKLDEEPNIIISVVTKAEMESFVLQNQWGAKKIEKLEKLLENITVIDINQSDNALLSQYSQVDSFSKGKGVDKKGNKLGGSARKMGKNDLWIAATASALDISLITTDGDFDHLNQTFIDVIKVK
ncbi:type II toxin-antitoxin system VapC family toxin [Sediminibacterium sp.]|uniref:type II toxin-antitoxin system VapC family toxin n=1 Tax=Sediminibacterium sp. TaxID=1917865 RepID=UPI003F702F44